MRLRWAHIVVLAAVLAMVCGCGRRARVIPAEKLSRIYHDMFLADQWLRDHPAARKAADTTLVFDPIFRRYGYTFEDYDRSVHYYLDRPEQYAKILDRADARLRKEGDRMQVEADEQTAREIELNRYRRAYTARPFGLDSLGWIHLKEFRPPTVELFPEMAEAEADTTAAAPAEPAEAVEPVLNGIEMVELLDGSRRPAPMKRIRELELEELKQDNNQ